MTTTRRMMYQEPAQQVPLYLQDRGADAPKAFAWWYRIAAPRAVSPDADLEQRDIVRRGRLASVVLLVELLIGIAVLPIALLGPNKATFGLAMVIYVSIVIFALLFNRRGQIGIAGTLLVIALEGVVMLDIITTPGGVDVFTLPMFDVLAQADLIAVSLLAAWSVFLVAGVNSVFAIVVLSFAPRTPALLHALQTQGYDAYLRPVVLQVILAFVTFLWVSGALKAIARADRAEEIARLEHDLSQQAQVAAAQKRELEQGTQQILQTHVRVANGDLHARVALPVHHPLWPIAGSLNTLLARLQRLRHAEYELQQARQEIVRLHLEQRQNHQSFPSHLRSLEEHAFPPRKNQM